MKRFTYFLLAILFVSFAGFSKPKHRVVVHLNTADTTAWHGVVRNVGNLQTALGVDTQIEVVAHGAGISFLIDSKTTQKAKIEELALSGVKFMACENTIRDRKIDRKTILPIANFVPSGVAEIVLKQEEGWSYLKP
ncbi:hypothetical protein EOJ36_03225 [Sandaracinomonas limnophila]|uniref:Uncharacterized protein n=1 Tax=Sandaracinomonas limnophila TaxID=1862386 RepID=A0A437PXP8_9BACT|nr:DsrE family protein [Sandaracinomonas limnophila]RVU27022.1 hypothetical protein EOJ36_03225 [Sandaracinomonas limnophila]